MSAKPENQKPAVLVPSGGNVRTPQNTVPTRRSSRLFGSTQVNFWTFSFFLEKIVLVGKLAFDVQFFLTHQKSLSPSFYNSFVYLIYKLPYFS